MSPSIPPPTTWRHTVRALADLNAILHGAGLPATGKPNLIAFKGIKRAVRAYFRYRRLMSHAAWHTAREGVI